MKKQDYKSYFNSLLENKWGTALLLFIAVLVSRILFLEHYFSDVDTVGYALGSVSYSLEQTRPHLPGYFLHVMIIKVLNLITYSPHKSMIILSLFYSSSGALLIWFLLKKYFSSLVSLAGTLLIAVNPLIWYYGCTTDIYVFDLFFSAGFVLLGISKMGIYVLPMFLAAGLGIRPSSGILLVPLYIYFWYCKRKESEINVRMFSLAHIGAIIIFAAWFYPMALSTGSVAAYFNLFKYNNPLPSISLSQNIFQFSSYLFWFCIPLVLAFIYLLFTFKLKNAFNATTHFLKQHKLFVIWFLFPFLFFVLFHYNRGYLNLIAVPLLLPVIVLFEKKILSGNIFVPLIIVCAAIFVLIPSGNEKAENWFKPELRHTRIVSTWAERTFSSYSMTASRIKDQDEIINGMVTLIDKAKIESGLKAGTVFLDPSVYSYARTMEYTFPDVTFITFDFNDPDSYIEYSEGNIQRLAGFKYKLKGCFLLANKAGLNSYLAGMGLNDIMSEKNLGIYLISPENADNISYIFGHYFQRGKN